MSNSTPDGMALVTVVAPEKPNLETAAQQLGVDVKDLDQQFGVVPVNPKENLYCVQVRADRLPSNFESEQPYRGPWANPEIAPFGPVQSAPDKKDPKR